VLVEPGGHADSRQRGSHQSADLQPLHSLAQVVATDSSVQLRELERRSRLLQNHPTQLGGSSLNLEPRLLLPCAVRSAAKANQLRWLYQLPTARAEPPVALDKFASERSIAFVREQRNETNPRWQQTFAGQSNHKHNSAGSRERSTRFVLANSYLAIEWPSKAQSGRYLGQLIAAEGGEPRTVCDTNVIIGEPLSVRLEAKSPGAELPASMAAQRAPTESEPVAGSWLSRATQWLGLSPLAGSRLASAGGRLSRRNSDVGEAGSAGWPQRIQAGGRGHIGAPPIARIGAQLQLNCLASGNQVDSIRWFRNGRAINTQSSSDFQVEISTRAMPERPELALEGGERLLSSLLVRQLQPSHSGLQLFECFARGSLGERARAGLAVFVAEQRLLEWAKSECPLASQEAAPGERQAESLEEEEEEEDGEELAWSAQPGASLFRRHNPLARALLLEGEQAELVCPTEGVEEETGSAANRSLVAAAPSWQRLFPGEFHPSLPTFKGPQVQKAKETNPSSTSGALKGQLAEGKETKLSNSLGARNFNQLFSGDSRFVINGSSLQMRSPSKRHDEAVYVCFQASARQQEQPASATPEAGSWRRKWADPPSEPAPPGVHQSSLASRVWAPASCARLLEWALARSAQSELAAHFGPISSISIRIVGE